MRVADYFISAVKNATPSACSLQINRKLAANIFGGNSWNKKLESGRCFLEKIFPKMIRPVATNQAYLGANRKNTFEKEKFNLIEIVIYRYDFVLTMTTSANIRVFFITLEDFDFLDMVFLSMCTRAILF